MLEKSLGHKNQRVAYTLNLLGELYAKQCKFEHDGYAYLFVSIQIFYFEIDIVALIDFS